jgi:hypothetical protein
MGDLLATLKRIGREQDLKSLSPEERRALETTQKEAEKIGSNLENGGLGGIPYSLALGIFRRDSYQCKRCSGRDGLGLHHKGGIESSHWNKKGKSNIPANLVVLCAKCHDSVHDKDRQDG